MFFSFLYGKGRNIIYTAVIVLAFTHVLRGKMWPREYINLRFMTHIILAGPTNSGKSTQAKRLQEAFPDTYVCVDSGELLRNRSKENDAIGNVLREYIARGEWAPQEITLPIIWEKIKEIIAQGRFCALTFARVSEEAASYLKSIFSHENVVVIMLDNISEETIIKRARLRKRSDDEIDILQKKYAAYCDVYKTRLALWREQGYHAVHVDASKTEDEVFETLVGIIQKSTK